MSTRKECGLFGPQWFCPQLESTIIPQGVGGFVWKTPGGNAIAFKKDQVNPDLFSDQGEVWLAKTTDAYQEIWNEEGWVLDYERGHLKTITSPTGRALHYTWNGQALEQVDLVDTATGTQMTLIKMAYSNGSYGLSDLSFNGIDHLFGYQSSYHGALDSWTAPNGSRLYFAYANEGMLAQTQSKSGELLTFYTMLYDSELSSSDRKDPTVWWLVEDPENKYSYERNPKRKSALLADKVNAISKTGFAKTVNYNPAAGMVMESTPAGRTQTTTFYHAPGKSYNGKVKSIEENGLIKCQYSYDPKTGLLSSITDANGNTQYFDYPPGWTRSKDSPWDPQPIRVWSGTPSSPKVTAQFQYDSANRVIAAQDANGRISKYTYDSRGQLSAVTAPDGVDTKMTYDAFGRCVKTATAGQEQSVEYDAVGRVVSKTLPDGSKTGFVYDNLGNVAQVIRNGKVVAENIRDSSGTLIGRKDALGHLQKISSDAHGNITAQVDASGATTRYEYDAYGRRMAQIDGNGNRISFTFDPASHISQQTNALGDKINWIYDNNGNLTEQDNGVQKIKRSYDEQNQLTSIDYGAPGQQVNYTYDDRGRISSMETSLNSFFYVYSPEGQLMATRAVSDNNEQLMRFKYNDLGQRTGLILAKLIATKEPTAVKVGHDAHYDVLQQTDWNYDNRRLQGISSNGVPIVSYKYDGSGRPALKTFNNGIVGAITYDPMGHLARIQFSGGPLTSPLILTYEWNMADQVTRRTWNGESQRYEYDLDGRLLKVVADDANKSVLEAYAYDKAGNITSKTLQGQTTALTYNAGNELISLSEGGHDVHYSYDKAGRMLAYSGGPTNTYGWLDKVIKSSLGYGGDTVFTYWPDGQLATKGGQPSDSVLHKVADSSQGTTEHFLWDGLALLRRDDTIYIAEPHPSGGATIASHPVDKPNEVTYYLNDLLGTTLAIVKGNSIEFDNTTSFGQMRSQTTSAPAPTDIGTTPPSPAVKTP